LVKSGTLERYGYTELVSFLVMKAERHTDAMGGLSCNASQMSPFLVLYLIFGQLSAVCGYLYM